MSWPARLRSMLKAMGGVALASLLVLLFVHDRGTLNQARALAQRLDAADQDRLEALVADRAEQVLRPQASLVDGRRGELLDELRTFSDQPALRAWASSIKAGKAKATRSKPLAAQAVLDRVAAAAGGWAQVLLLDPTGKVLAQWPKPGPGRPSELGSDLSKQALVRALAQPGQGPGLALHSYRRWTAAPNDAAAYKNKVSVSAQLEAVCGIGQANGPIQALLLARVGAVGALLGGEDPDLLALVRSSPGAVAMLLRGNGDEVWNSAKNAFSENLASISGDYRQVLAELMKKPSGRYRVASYDGHPGVMVWHRVGSAPEGSQPVDVLSLAVFMPQTAYAASAGAGVEAPQPWYQRPWVLLLALLALGLPLAVGWIQLPKLFEPFQATAKEARKVEEFSPVPELTLATEPDADAQAINRALAVLARRTQQGEERVRELDLALRRVEEQASRDATVAGQDLSSLREKVGSSDAARQAAEAKFGAAQKARLEAEAQLGNLRSALETATRNTELKAAENRNLSAQVQDLMRAMEEQRKVAEKAQESLARKDNEVVRLAAVNTLSSELKATLSVIKNYINTMLGSQGAISDAQQEFLGVVINKSARLERLIGDLVELSELGSGVKPLRLESVAPSVLVQEALLNARPQAEAKKINLELAESGNLSPVMVDREKMGAVLRSLLSQAVKVTSRNERISLLLSEREATVELRVSDPGMSLPPDRSAKVFNQFHGVDSQAGPEFIGTGLRFPILKSLVEAHGGKIWIESQVGRGKTFVVAMAKAGAVPAATLAPAPVLAMVPPPLAVVKAAPLVSPPTVNAPPPLPKSVLPTPVEKAAPAPSPVIHKPAPLDDSLNSPWKRKESRPDDDLLEETMDLAPPLLSGKAVPSLPPLAPVPLAPAVLPGLPALPPPAPLTTGAKPDASDQADFDKVFGALQAGEAAPGALPKVELKTGAKPDDQDLAQFSSVFGGAVPKAAPPGLGAPPPPQASPPSPAPTAGPGVPPMPDATDFDAIFGAAPAASAPLAAPSPAPRPLAPPPAPTVKPAVPPGLGDLDAIFGASPTPAAPPKPAQTGDGLNTLDDLNRMLGN